MTLHSLKFHSLMVQVIKEKKTKTRKAKRMHNTNVHSEKKVSAASTSKITHALIQLIIKLTKTLNINMSLILMPAKQSLCELLL